jgi:hypothetical protein
MPHQGTAEQQNFPNHLFLPQLTHPRVERGLRQEYCCTTQKPSVSTPVLRLQQQCWECEIQAQHGVSRSAVAAKNLLGKRGLIS